MTHIDRNGMLQYVIELEAAALHYAERYGLTPQMSTAMKSRPSVFEWENLIRPVRPSSPAVLKMVVDNGRRSQT